MEPSSKRVEDLFSDYLKSPSCQFVSFQEDMKVMTSKTKPTKKVKWNSSLNNFNVDTSLEECLDRIFATLDKNIADFGIKVFSEYKKSSSMSNEDFVRELERIRSEIIQELPEGISSSKWEQNEINR